MAVTNKGWGHKAEAGYGRREVTISQGNQTDKMNLLDQKMDLGSQKYQRKATILSFRTDWKRGCSGP